MLQKISISHEHENKMSWEWRVK